MLDARRARVAPERPVLAATLTQVRKRCGQATCRCHHGEPHLAWHLTYKVKGKTRTVYVPVDLLDEVRSWIAEHKRIKTVLDEIHHLTVALIRTHVQTRKRKAGRP
jgi:DNA-binding transcriptional regulator LsrR (DeoR family)